MAADLQGKYQKLAQEYSKLRAQNQVLKKAVLDEQANSAALKEQMKMKDQSLRKLQQEMDSLIFRNQQLAKRVELLQEELVVLEVKGKKNKKSDSTSQLNQQQQSVFDEDLQKKIEENERLHIQFFEADEKHKQVESELQARLEVLEKDAAQHQAVVDGLTQKYMDTIEKLQNDKAKLEVKSQTLEREAKDCRLRTEECQQQLKTFHEDLSRKLDQSIYIIQEKVPFNDTKYGQYNVLNVPPHNKRQQLKARDITGQALTFLRDLVAALLNFHTYTEQRVQIFPIDTAIDTISPLNQKFSQYLHENASYVRPMEEGMLHLFESITEDTVTTLETAVKLKEFSHHLISYTCFLKKILPYQLKSLEEECMSSLCTSTLRARNMELYSDMKKMTAAFEKLQTYISLLALPSTKPEALPQMNFSAVCTQLAACLHGLYDVMKDISKHFNQKITLEQELPTVTQKLKTTNDCILSSVVTLANVTGKIATYFSNNLDFFTTSSGYGPKGGKEVMNPLSVECMLQYKKKAVAYIASVKPPQLESVPYEEALSNRRVLLSSTESREGLAQQVQQSQEKIAKLEQEKEHWMLEAQLAKIKLQKENQRIAELDTQLKHALGGQTTTLESMKEHAVTHNKTGGEVDGKDLKEPFRSTSLIGMLTVINSEEVPDGEFREDLIKNHYMTRVAELTSQLQVADSKAVHFYAECRALAKRLSLAEKSREVLTEEIKLANQNITRLQDELTTTKRSYEDQLSMMSDHLCSMNDTLSKQREEIDTLKMSSKGNSKKNRSR
ncbi:protein phosphatase 1 regulatory subunit 21 isoform X2 [Latimeria chalumnae]|uniref:protein phosphatase 1 regulatory subunit 21 isoform X2 n=1 Tax=Latimeria chalumnae TaxID=7897 RepID=UPI0003C1A671|nr:PREDICTED: protein phosphatase 1 regulatory subunit 21 isoform X2 [Latimeria chalumnae]|eukprot:XP_005999343.1 PREDICTED: protein phosphatase 1 regulatory subunit 21 isoform X2 [Latimeria chalumnae]